MKPRMKLPDLKKEERWKLKNLTCVQLAELVVRPLPTDYKPSKLNEALRRRYKHPDQLHKLKLCGSLKASHHAAWTRTAALFLRVPTLVLTATGGKPKADSMPPFTASLKRLGALNGVVIHRYEKGAFILAKNPPRPEPAPAKLCDQSFELAP